VERPATAFVGRFVLQGNLLPAQASAVAVETPLGLLRPVSGDAVQVQAPAGAPAGAAEPLQVLVSPQGLRFAPDPAGEAWVLGREFLGREWLYQVRCRLFGHDLQLRLRLPLAADYPRGQRGHLQLVPGERARLYPSGQELAVH
jgi:iron(III) transport system ATP-binding protein